nr:hypothetical protein 22 [bacterium]
MKNDNGFYDMYGAGVKQASLPVKGAPQQQVVQPPQPATIEAFGAKVPVSALAEAGFFLALVILIVGLLGFAWIKYRGRGSGS